MAGAVSANAASLLYELEGNNSISFVIDSDPENTELQPDGFVVPNVMVAIDGISALYDIGFVYSFADGGLIIEGTPFDLAGPQLYSGSETSPTLLAGSYDLVGFLDPGLVFSLTVTDLDVVSAVPEPATWILFAGAFFLIGGAMRSAVRASKLRYA
ncbi:hypothetical protein [Qipengyuania atrilutea]|uniref:PEP-CTERM protein-sorting domain-containing protein n=1 Tax=Qipengyuania atrilutea TaxID=2744473 RepID=A0A850H4D0_9SPHN|nr:hypothetical protein [Actirhodobacter atriluteus]NVD45377.1 hypothetical protein [Actirhodobacter atriluteus]